MRSLGTVGNEPVTAVIQMDNRFCGIMPTNASAADSSTSVTPGVRFCRPVISGSSDATYWMRSLAINALWAARWGYLHLTYCAHECPHQDSGEARHVVWCKIVALAHAMARLPQDAMVLYLDSDAWWDAADLSLPALLHWQASTSILMFACNWPYLACRAHGRRGCGTEWNKSLKRSPPNTGVVLARNTVRARALLQLWWNTPSMVDATDVVGCPEQQALWHLMSASKDFRQDVGVFTNSETSPWYNSSGWLACMQTNMAQLYQPMRPPIVQVDHFFELKSRRTRYNEMATSIPLDNATQWCSSYVRLSEASSTHIGLGGPLLKSATCVNRSAG